MAEETVAGQNRTLLVGDKATHLTSTQDASGLLHPTHAGVRTVGFLLLVLRSFRFTTHTSISPASLGTISSFCSNFTVTLQPQSSGDVHAELKKKSLFNMNNPKTWSRNVLLLGCSWM